MVGMASQDVFVAGGGIAGLALARALRAQQIPVSVAERGDATVRHGLAINLPGNAIAAFDRLGLGAEVRAAGYPVHRREYRTARDKLLFGVDEAAFWGPDAVPHCVRRSDLLAILGRDIPVRRPVAVTAVRPQGTTVEIELDGQTTETYGFVAGADGVRSTVRAAVTDASGVRIAPLSSASWRLMAPNPGVAGWTGWSGPAGTFLLIPVSGDEVYGYASATGGGTVTDDPAWLFDTFGGYPEPVQKVLASHTELYHSPITEVRLSTWARGRCALVGDAAHATAPVWAQGAALALEDALTLAEVLAQGDWDTAGQRYLAERSPRVAHVQYQTDRFTRTAGLPTWLRDRIAPFVGPKSYQAAYGPLRAPAQPVPEEG
jgi:2-polyprenyl-6-methoxyphenol hydroxylase-like FAD-dependent oxidoreductase